MNSRVVLTMKGLQEQQYTFTDPKVCMVGRASDCLVQIPGQNWFAQVSRHHCRLEIDPPTVMVRDLGSLNGTFVNGKIIGRRDSKLPQNAPSEFPSYLLHDGDEIRVGDVVFEVSIVNTSANSYEATVGEEFAILNQDEHCCC